MWRPIEKLLDGLAVGKVVNLEAIMRFNGTTILGELGPYHVLIPRRRAFFPACAMRMDSVVLLNTKSTFRKQDCIEPGSREALVSPGTKRRMCQATEHHKYVGNIP